MQAYQRLEVSSEADNVRPIARIRIMKERDLEIGGNGQGQADQSQVGALALRMSALRKATSCGRVDERVEICAVKSHATRGDAVDLNESGCQFALNVADHI